MSEYRSQAYHERHLPLPRKLARGMARIAGIEVEGIEAEHQPSPVFETTFTHYIEEGEEREVVAYKQSPNLGSQLREAEHGQRSTEVRAVTYSSPGKSQIKRENEREVFLTEGELLQEYATFLQDTYDVAVRGGDEHMQDRVADFFEKTTFIGEKELDEATTNLAYYWANYLASDPNNRIYLYCPYQQFEGKQKSPEFVTKMIFRKFSELAREANQDELTNRVEYLSEGITLQHANPRHTKIVMAEDWLTSGETLQSKHMPKLHRFLRTKGAESLADTTELNLVVARGDQVESGIHYTYTPPDQDTTKTQSLKTVAYYRSPTIEGWEKGPTPTGYHSSVDIGFEYVLNQFAGYREQHGVSSQVPAIADVKRSYY